MGPKKAVLEEDEYVSALGAIIERDFFPDLSKLKSQKAHLDGLPVDGQLTATTLHGAGSTSVRSATSGWDHPSPARAAGGADEEADDGKSVRAGEDLASDSDHMTLNQFVATHTSEDNEAFNELQEKAVDEHRRRYHWAYDVDPNKGDPKLHLLQDGSWISKEQRLLADAACSSKGPKDDRPSAPETWNYRARNPLLFPPELKTTRAICGVTPESTERLLLENGQRDVGNRRIGQPPKAKKTTVFANSRFQSDEGINAVVDGESSLGTPGSDYSLVRMTPLIAPGVDASPLMTWGDIEATPMIVGGSQTPERVLNGPKFEMRDSSAREKVADRLEAQTRQRKTTRRRSGVLSPLRSSVTRKRSAHEPPTPSLARSVRSRMSSVRSSVRTPFGSDSQLRSSYSTPLRPPRHSISKSRK